MVLTGEEEIGTRSGRAVPSFSARPEKEAKGAVLHGTSAAERLRHVKTRSANLPKLSRSRGFKHMGRFVFALRSKIPSRATQLVKRYAASAFRQRPAAHKDAGYETDQKPCFFVHFFLLLDLIDKLGSGIRYMRIPLLLSFYLFYSPCVPPSFSAARTRGEILRLVCFCENHRRNRPRLPCECQVPLQPVRIEILIFFKLPAHLPTQSSG